ADPTGDWRATLFYKYRKRCDLGAERLCVIHKRHHIGSVTFADHWNLRAAGRDFAKVALGEFYIKCAHVLLEIANALCPGDGDKVFALGKNPSKRQLRRGRALLAGEFFYCFRQFQVGLQSFLPETRICPAPITGVKVLKFLDRPCQETASERAV